MKSSQIWIYANESTGGSWLTLPRSVSKAGALQRGGDHAAPAHSTAEACFGCVDWFSYDRLEHTRVDSSWQATAAR